MGAGKGERRRGRRIESRERGEEEREENWEWGKGRGGKGGEERREHLTQFLGYSDLRQEASASNKKKQKNHVEIATTQASEASTASKH